MLKLNFHSFAEKKPKIGQEILYLKREYSFDSEYFAPHENTVEAQWTQLEDGEECGVSICYDPEDPTPPEPFTEDGVEITFRLDMMVDGWILEDHWFWMPLQKYWDAFDKADNK